MQSLIERMAATIWAVSAGDQIGRAWDDVPAPLRSALAAGVAAALRDAGDLEAIEGDMRGEGDGCLPTYLASGIWRRMTAAAVTSWAAADPVGAAMLAGRGRA